MRAAQDYAPHNEFAPLDWLDRLVEAGAADIVALMDIADNLPTHTLVLREKAVGLHSQIAKLAEKMADDGPTGQRRQVLAAALNNLANSLSEVGKREEALEVAREAVSLYRALAAANPDAFTVDLATSLGAMHSCERALSRGDKALATIGEALEILTPLFRALPTAHARLMAQVGRAYVELAEALDREPDGKLLGPVDEIFSLLESGAEDDSEGK
jgi:tetratricopeptide (TPR) repeat protein